MGEMVIRELEVLGGTPPTTSVATGKGSYEIFRWDAKHRNLPLKPFSFGVDQRTVRTDYPGADDPTEQILGPNFTPFTLRGRWDDRYNIDRTSARELASLVDTSGEDVYEALGGYAVREWKRFEAMVRRGNPVRITFEKIVIEGIITNFQVSYLHRARIEYEFTVSPHHRQPGGFYRLLRSPRTALSARQLYTELLAEVDALLEQHAIAPQTQLTGTIYVDAESGIDDIQAYMAAIDVAIEQRNLTPDLEPNAALLRMASLFYSTTTLAQTLIAQLDGYDTSEALAYESGAGNLDFDTWARGVMYYARRIIVVGRRAASDIAQRAEPNAMALYTPYTGESLYGISLRFYGTPHEWRKIARRNGLTTLTLAGTETLVIPEVTTR